MANGRSVTRDRYCPRCRNRFTTVEQFAQDIRSAEQKQQEQVHDLNEEIHSLNSQLSEHSTLFTALGNAIKKAGKP